MEVGEKSTYVRFKMFINVSEKPVEKLATIYIWVVLAGVAACSSESQMPSVR
jgi:hypothetical protein